MIVNLSLFHIFALEGCDDLKGILEVGHFTNGVLEPCDFNQFLHPGRFRLQQSQKGLFAHTGWQSTKNEGDFLNQLLL